MQPTVLITLGRLPKGLDLARSFRRLGWRVIVAEPFRWHLSAMSNAVARRYTVTAPAIDRERYLGELCDIVMKEGVELVVPVSEEIMHASHLAGRLPRGVRLYSMAPDVLLPLHDKLQFIGRCRDYGVAAPATCALGTPGGADLAQAGDHIVKPVFSCSGRGVLFRSQGEPLPETLPGKPAIVQRWVKGSVLSTFSIASVGKPLVTVVYRGAVMSGTVAVCFERVGEDDPHHRPVVDWVERFVGGAGFSGFISFDLVVFPFSAIVGQDEMKLAILIAAVDPSVGGVLVFGDRGTGKSTAVRALAALLPPMKRDRAGCRYHCDPATRPRLLRDCARWSLKAGGRAA
jgi:hypothetical protein